MQVASDPSLGSALLVLNTRADAYAAMADAGYGDFCVLNGDDPEAGQEG